MIDSTSSSSSQAAQTSVLAANLQKPAPARYSAGQDNLSTDGSSALQAGLAGQPEVRPEEVARGKELAADPNYPSADVIRSIAAQIVNSPDLSEDES